MAPNYSQLTIETMEKLPIDKKAEVYDFVCFLRRGIVPSHVAATRNKKASILKIIGLGKSCVTDGALNHDQYLYS